jgi:hypothetical protein
MRDMVVFLAWFFVGLAWFFVGFTATSILLWRYRRYRRNRP